MRLDVQWTYTYIMIVLLPFTSLLAKDDLADNERDVPLFYWDARLGYPFTNFGDVLSEKIVERIVVYPISTVTDSSWEGRKLLAVGSILVLAKNKDIIWGSGAKHSGGKERYRFTELDVRAVRGPLTRQVLLDLGIDCPEIYGDPALLLPRLFPEFTKPEQPSKEYILIPHFNDERLFKGYSNIVSVKEEWDEVIKQILDSQFVVSTSLHGLIVAEAFGIPARYLRVSEGEPLFKYKDYYYGTNRYDFKYAVTLEEALAMGGESPPECDLDKLLSVFPFHLFPVR